jgi:hypothetical protein
MHLRAFFIHRQPGQELEDWFHKQYQQLVLEGKAGAPTGPCPEHAFLRELARKPASVSMLDPRIEHVGTCANCFREMLHLRSQPRHSYWSHLWVTWGMAVAFGLFLLVGIFYWQRSQPVQTYSVDLTSLSLPRGPEAGDVRPLSPVSLSRTRLQLAVRLPVGSPTGSYTAGINRPNIDHALASSLATSKPDNNAVLVSFSLDFRHVPGGTYTLTVQPQHDVLTFRIPVVLR